MGARVDPDTDELIEQAMAGDAGARQRLLERSRGTAPCRGASANGFVERASRVLRPKALHPGEVTYKFHRIGLVVPVDSDSLSLLLTRNLAGMRVAV